MAFEMICGQCRGNLLVEQFGVVVACPHCGAHLHIPAPADQTPPAPAPVPTPPEPVPQPEPVAAPEPIAPEPASENIEPTPAPLTEEIRAFTGEESEPPPSVEISVAPSIEVSVATEPQAADSPVTEETPAPAAGDGGFSLSTLLAAPATDEAITTPTPDAIETQPADDSMQAAVTEAATPVESPLPTESVPTQATSEPAAVSATATEPSAASPSEAVPSGLSGLFGSSATSTDEAAVAAEQSSHEAADSTLPEVAATAEEHPETSSLVEPEPAAATIKPASNDRVMVSKMMLVLLLSYASAMTLGFGWLLYQIKTGAVGGDSLESLPDPVPVKTTGFHWYSPKTPMTAGHDLKIGDTQRFGNIKVTVLKVTRGPIQFRHFSDPSQTRPPSFPVLKLWLKFENVSDDQEIAPLDDQLLFRRFGRNFFEYKSSQFVCRADEKKMRNPRFVIAYDHIIGSGWDLAGLPLDKPLAPHESREYYVPTCEHGIDDLTGDLVWRVQIRKGYSSRGNGVTTLFEVHFDSQDIRDEPA